MGIGDSGLLGGGIQVSKMGSLKRAMRDDPSTEVTLSR